MLFSNFGHKNAEERIKKNTDKWNQKQKKKQTKCDRKCDMYPSLKWKEKKITAKICSNSFEETINLYST